MAFLDDLSKKITDASQGVAQSTKNFAEVNRLTGMISDKEKEVLQLYTSLGQLYYEQHSRDPEADGIAFIGAINTLKEDIARCREEIKRIKGVGKCPSCGAELSQGAAFCPNCGAAIPKETAPAEVAASAKPQRLCPSCGKMVDEDNKFCNYCGAKME